jgi:hypothetical protein
MYVCTVAFGKKKSFAGMVFGAMSCVIWRIIPFNGLARQ